MARKSVQRVYGPCSYCGQSVVTYGDPEDRALRRASRHSYEGLPCRGRGSFTHRSQPKPASQEVRHG